MNISYPIGYLMQLWYAESMKTLNLVCHPSWMASELKLAEGFFVNHSFGLDALRLAGEALWSPQQYASDLFRAYALSGMDLPILLAPGPNWLTTVPSSFLGREVASILLSEVRAEPTSYSSGWWKAAEAKIDFFPNSYRTSEGMLDQLELLPDDTRLQFTSTSLDIKKEYRFWVTGRKVTTGSLYLSHEDGATYYDGASDTEEEFSKASAFASNVLVEVDAPSAFTLDIALLGDGSCVVLEGNPAWCSAWYGADVTKVAETIYAATTSVTPGNLWAWSPDAYHVHKSNRKRVLQLV